MPSLILHRMMREACGMHPWGVANFYLTWTATDDWKIHESSPSKTIEGYGHVWTWEGPRYGTALCTAFQELLERLREEVHCFQIMEQPCAFI